MGDDLTLKNLDSFRGTENYHSVLGADVTDGVAYIMNNGYSWFVTDAIAVIKNKLWDEDFLAVKLKIYKKGKYEAKMTIEDGNEKVLYEQNYNFTTAKKELLLFWNDGVLMLSSEY